MKNGLRLVAALLALVFAICFCGCKDDGDYTPQLTLSTDMPTPNTTDENIFTAQLYFVAEGGSKLVVEEREITYNTNGSRAEAAIIALLDGPDTPSYMSSIPANMELERVELSTNVCNVFFIGNMPGSLIEWLTARVAIASTVAAVEGIEAVNVYVNGMEPGYEELPLGVATPIMQSLGTFLTNTRYEYDTLLKSQFEQDAALADTSTATLYYADKAEQLLIAQNVELEYAPTIDKGKLAEVLIEKLVNNEGSESELISVLTSEFMLASTPTVEYSEMRRIDAANMPQHVGADADELATDGAIVGARLLNVVMQPLRGQYDEKKLCAVITLTLTGYIPGLNGVRISIQEEDGTLFKLGSESYFSRRDFISYIGREVMLAYPDSTGSLLINVPRAVEGSGVYSPYLRLAELLNGPADPGMSYPLFTGTDVDSAYITGDTAVVNWKAGFTEKLYAMIRIDEFDLPRESRERLFIYSVVNTLTEIPGVNRVWMLENGKKLGSIENIYLGNALLRNPGLTAGS